MARIFSGRRLKARRRDAGLSRERLAHLVGRSVFSIDGYERGLSLPSVGTLAAMADHLDISLDDLFEAEAVTHAA